MSQVDIEIVITIIGSVLPLLFSFLQRYIKVSENMQFLIVVVTCLSVAFIGELIGSGWDFYALFRNFVVVLGTSQLIYKGIMKPEYLGTSLKKVVEGR